jgi:predicted aspartyl protease
MAQLLGYDPSRPTARRSIFGAQGVVAEVPSFRLASLRVDGIVVEGLEVLVVTFSPRVKIHGVIGVNFLERFRPTLEFDTATLVLRMRSV